MDLEQDQVRGVVILKAFVRRTSLSMRIHHSHQSEPVKSSSTRLFSAFA